MSTVSDKTRRLRWLGRRPSEQPILGKVVRSGRRRNRRLLLLTVALLLLALWFAPAIVAHTPLRNQLLGTALPQLEGGITADGASLGWLSPVVLNDVQVKDADGKLLLSAASIQTETSLGRLLHNRTDLGTIRVTRPQLQLNLTAQSSNLEHTLAAWFADAPASETAPPAARLEIVDGEISVHDLPTGSRLQLEDVRATLVSTPGQDRPLGLDFSGTSLQPDGMASIKGSLKSGRPPSSDQAVSPAVGVSIETQRWPLASLQPLLRRTAPGVKLSGQLTSKLNLAWRADSPLGPTLDIDGQITTRQLAVGGVFAGRDELRLEQATIPAKLAWAGNQLKIAHLQVDCDLGRASLRGPLEIEFAPDGPNWLAALLEQTYEIEGQLDLARLAGILPETIRLREGTHLTAGQLIWKVSKGHTEGRSTWEGELEASKLTAIDRGREINWQQPIRLTFAAHDDSTGPVVDRLLCESSFLQAEGKGTLNDITLSANYDLSLLTAELGRFFDLGGLQLAGDGWTYITCQRTAEGRFQAEGEFQVSRFRLDAPSRQPWAEQQLVIEATVTGQSQGDRPTRIDTANLAINSKPDRATLLLREAVDLRQEQLSWPVDVVAEGELATWRTRLAPLVVLLPDWDLSGACRLEATTRLSADELRIDHGRCQLERLHAHSPLARIDEPQALCALRGLQQRGGQWRIEAAHVSCPTVTADAQHVQLVSTETGGPQLAVTVDYLGDLSRLERWFSDPGSPSTWHVGGHVRGKIKLSPEDATGLPIATETHIDRLVVQPPGGQPWHEPRVRLLADGRYVRLADQLLLEQVQLVSAPLEFEARGQIDELSSRRQLQLAGEMDVDTVRLVELLRPYLGESVKVVDQQQRRPFSVAGPLAALFEDGTVPGTPPQPWYTQFAAQAGIGWTGAEMYGLRLASGELRASLKDGVVQWAPLDLAVNEGRLNLAGRLHLGPGPAQLEIDRGPLLTQVRITPEMCQRGLAYIAPALAGVTQAEGKLSIALEGARLPLEQPQLGELAGQMTVHSVEIGPGPMIRELAVLIDRAGAARLSQESVVPFRLVQGRVYHRDLELVFPDLTIRTHGSVGLDRSLAILAEMPVPPKWIGDNRVASVIKDQTIRLPIGGTLENPRLDQQALQQASAEFLRQGSQKMLFEGLNRLFGPKPRE